MTQPNTDTAERIARKVNDYYVDSMFRARQGDLNSAEQEIAALTAIINTELAESGGFETGLEAAAKICDKYEQKFRLSARQPNHGRRGQEAYQDMANGVERVKIAIRASAARPAQDGCKWKCDPNPDCEFWETDCGKAFQFETGGPKENKMRFCSYCGKPLID